MVRRGAAKKKATKAKLDQDAIMAEIEASIRKKVRIYLSKQKRGSSYDNKKRQNKNKANEKE